jgi:glycine dehydrogenase subunit 1
MVTIFLTVYGKEGLRELAEHNLAKADYLKGVLASSSGEGAKVLFEGAPRFHEFVLELPASAEETNAALLEDKIIGGLPLAKWYPELGPNASLWCATEVTTRKQMDAAAASLRVVAPAAELARA